MNLADDEIDEVSLSETLRDSEGSLSVDDFEPEGSLPVGDSELEASLSSDDSSTLGWCWTGSSSGFFLRTFIGGASDSSLSVVSTLVQRNKVFTIRLFLTS